jgi:flagellar protein FlgJ
MSIQRIGSSSSLLGATGTVAPVTPREVAAQKTSVSMDQVRDALARAHVKVTGRAPSAALIDTLSAQVAVETANGQKMFNYNFGGLKGHSPQGDMASYRTREVFDGKSVHLNQGFRAYRSLDEGAADYLSVMYGRFGQAMAPAERGDVAGFSHALKASGYFTAPEAEYTSALESRMGIVHRERPMPELSPPPGLVPGADFDRFPTEAMVGRFVDAIFSASNRIPVDDEDF